MICLEGDAMTGLWLYNTRNIALHPTLVRSVLAVLYSPSQLCNVCSIFVWEFLKAYFSRYCDELGMSKMQTSASDFRHPAIPTALGY